MQIIPGVIYCHAFARHGVCPRGAEVSPCAQSAWYSFDICPVPFAMPLMSSRSLDLVQSCRGEYNRFPVRVARVPPSDIPCLDVPWSRSDGLSGDSTMVPYLGATRMLRSQAALLSAFPSPVPPPLLASVPSRTCPPKRPATWPRAAET